MTIRKMAAITEPEILPIPPKTTMRSRLIVGRVTSWTRSRSYRRLCLPQIIVAMKSSGIPPTPQEFVLTLCGS